MIYKCQKTKLFSLIPNLVMSLGLLANFERKERERDSRVEQHQRPTPESLSLNLNCKLRGTE